jgi:nucleoside-diphosphate-sugar epimerase
MRVLITGAGGNLGRAAIPVLEQEGHTLRLLDFRPLDTSHELVVGDVRDPEAVGQAMVDVDAVVHGAALHGVHLGTWPGADFWSINTGGTFTVYEAARAAGVRRVVLASSMVVYGGVGGEASRWGVRTEESPFAPGDVYGLTKVVAEDTARFFASVHHVDTVALRLGMFVPETFERYGFRLLFGGVDDRDVGQAVSLALAHDPQGRFAAFDIMADSGFVPEDLHALGRDIGQTLDQRWPGTAELVEAHGLDLDELVWGRLIFPVDKAKTDLGYRPRYDFAAFLDAWRRGDLGHYPYAGEPWWGMDNR